MCGIRTIRHYRDALPVARNTHRRRKLSGGCFVTQLRRRGGNLYDCAEPTLAFKLEEDGFSRRGHIIEDAHGLDASRLRLSINNLGGTMGEFVSVLRLNVKCVAPSLRRRAALKKITRRRATAISVAVLRHLRADLLLVTFLASGFRLIVF